MLLIRPIQHSFPTQDLLDLREQPILLIVVMFLDELEPGKAVSDEIGIIGRFHMRRLEIDRVEAPQNGVVE